MGPALVGVFFKVVTIFGQILIKIIYKILSEVDVMNCLLKFKLNYSHINFRIEIYADAKILEIYNKTNQLCITRNYRNYIT